MSTGADALRRRLDAGLERMALDPSPGQREALIGYVQLLAHWNQAFNLTAVREPLEMIPRHILDSLSIAPYVSGADVLDIGTGAGLPGIPLAICDPARRFVLLDSNGKKVRFVLQAVSVLGLTNLVPVQSRADAYRAPEKFATIVARAVAPLAELCHAADRLTTRPGQLLAMKGRLPHEELFAPALVHDQIVVHRLAVPFVEGERHLIEIRFARETS
jgi:16S rRNA (guanine527-N7)-methyltransferase